MIQEILFIVSLVLAAPPITLGDGKKSGKTNSRLIEVVVEEGAFHPDVIAVTSREIATISFTMKDDKLCKQKIHIKGLNIEVPISLNKKSFVELENAKPGKYHMECETGAFCGVLFVSASESDKPRHYFAPHPE